MIFNSLGYVCIFPLVVIVYYNLPHRWRKFWLLTVSYYFYSLWGIHHILLLMFITFETYMFGRFIVSTKKFFYKKLFLWCCIFISVGVLFYFKYLQWIISMVFSVLDVNVDKFAWVNEIILPVGISFFVFQSMGYVIDVYRNEEKVEKDIIYYALYVSFFPQLVAGPIERSGNLLNQFKTNNRFDFDNARDGLFIILYGYFLKIVVADRISVIVDTVYGNTEVYSGWYLIVVSILFAIQIYCDFAGYSIIAIGSAKILGISLMNNFESPYLALSVSEFWRRWHISLTSWFKDYVYIPLGGNRKGRIRGYLNKIVVFILSGLWHGADLSYIAWGG